MYSKLSEEYDKAVPLLKRALEIQEKKLGPENPEILETVRDLGYLYWGLEDYTKAENLFKTIIERQINKGVDEKDNSIIDMCLKVS